jgi:hypothetical protein
MAGKKKTNKTKPIDNLKHKDKRVNIFTEELRDFVKEDESRPETVLLSQRPIIGPLFLLETLDGRAARSRTLSRFSFCFDRA